MKSNGFPPGYKGMAEPEGFAREKEDLSNRLEDLFRRRSEWSAKRSAAMTLAWVEYHDEHGWPDDNMSINGETYEERMRRKAKAIERAT